MIVGLSMAAGLLTFALLVWTEWRSAPRKKPDAPCLEPILVRRSLLVLKTESGCPDVRECIEADPNGKYCAPGGWQACSIRAKLMHRRPAMIA